MKCTFFKAHQSYPARVWLMHFKKVHFICGSPYATDIKSLDIMQPQCSCALSNCMYWCVRYGAHKPTLQGCHAPLPYIWSIRYLMFQISYVSMLLTIENHHHYWKVQLSVLVLYYVCVCYHDDLRYTCIYILYSPIVYIHYWYYLPYHQPPSPHTAYHTHTAYLTHWPLGNLNEILVM